MPLPDPAPATSDLAICFLAHQWSPSIGRRFVRLRRELGAAADCFVLLQDDRGEVLRNWQSFLGTQGMADALCPFVHDALQNQLGYGWFGTDIMGSVHFPLLLWARQARYRHYWQVESDVEYRGHWGGLVGAFAQCGADLLGTHLHRHADRPDWPWWQSLSAPAATPLEPQDLHKAFLPIFRASLPALQAIDAAHSQGWKGHVEVLAPTVLARLGLQVQDLRDILPCYEGESQDPCRDVSQQSTMRWRPKITIAEFTRRGRGGLLFHPVKQNWAWNGHKVARWRDVTRSA